MRVSETCRRLLRATTSSATRSTSWHKQLDTAVARTVDLHRTGAPDGAVLAETALAVGAAKALELLTGESVEAQLEHREDRAAPDPPAPPPGWRRLRRSKR